MSDRTTIEDIVAREMRASGLSRDVAAERLGMSVAALGARLRGRTRWAAAELPDVAMLLGLDVADIYREVSR